MMDNMEDLGAKLSQIMDDPKQMEQLKNMAEGILGGGADFSSLLGGAVPDDLGAIMQLGKLLRSDTEDDRTRLLLALKPHLSATRRDRVDKAVKLLRIASLLPLISKQGLFDI